MPVTVVIPTLNEASRIGVTIDAAFAAEVSEVIVSDGGSTDGTIEIARSHGARILTGAEMRSRQLNLGAANATHKTLIFLHADTLLPQRAAEAVELAIENGVVFGGFRIAFLEPGLDGVAAMINARTRFTREPWGDQAQFIARDVFPGFREIPIMEDYALARRMKRAGRTAILPLTVRTSGRRFLELGRVRTATLNWLIIAAYHLGVSPERLAKWYRRTG